MIQTIKEMRSIVIRMAVADSLNDMVLKGNNHYVSILQTLDEIHDIIRDSQKTETNSRKKKLFSFKKA
jgi:hypothetical protein